MKKNILAIKMIFLCGFLTQASIVWAENAAASFLVDIAKSHLEHGQVQEAIHEFSKALLVEPDNQEAKQHLERLGLSQGLYHATLTSQAKEIRARQENEIYKEKLASLEQRNKSIEGQIKELETRQQSLNEENQIKDLESSVVQVKIKTTAETYEQQLKNKNDKAAKIEADYLAKVNGLKTKSSTQEKQVEEQRRMVEVKSMELSMLSDKLNQVLSKPLKIEDEAIANHYKAELDSLRREYNQLALELSLQKDKYDHVFKVLEDYIYVRRNELNEVGDRLIFREMDLVKNEHYLLDRLDELVSLHESLENTRSQINEKNDSLNAKNADIELLLKKLDTLPVPSPAE